MPARRRVGKRVTLFAKVLVDRGPATVNGRRTERVRRLREDGGDYDYLVLASVVDRLPVTHRRGELPAY